MAKPARTDRRRRARARLVLVAAGLLGVAVAIGLFLLTRPATSDRLCALGLRLLGREVGLKI
jgi:hypothetical protein